MMNKLMKMVAMVIMMVGMLSMKTEAKEMNETQNNILKAGKVIYIEYSENPESESLIESFDKMYFEVDNNVYLYYDFAEDTFIGDDVLVIMNTQGTESLKDDVIRDYRYWRPDLEIERNHFDKVENGTCVGQIESIDTTDTGMLVNFEDGTGFYYEIDED